MNSVFVCTEGVKLLHNVSKPSLIEAVITEIICDPYTFWICDISKDYLLLIGKHTANTDNKIGISVRQGFLFYYFRLKHAAMLYSK